MALPQALAELGVDVELMMPGFPQAVNAVRGKTGCSSATFSSQCLAKVALHSKPSLKMRPGNIRDALP